VQSLHRRDKMIDKLLQFEEITVSMSAANTSTEKSLNLGISAADNIVIELYEVFFDHDVIETPGAGNTKTLHMLLTNKTGVDGSAVHLADEDVIAYMEKSVTADAAGTSEHNMILQEIGTTNNRFKFPEPLLYPFNTIYLVMDTTGYSSAKNGRAKIFYKYKKINKADYIELLEYWNTLR